MSNTECCVCVLRPFPSYLLLKKKKRAHTWQVLPLSAAAHLKYVQMLKELLQDSIKYITYKSFGTLGELCPTILSPFAFLVVNETAALWFQA